jgi:hypothetical protein
MLKKLFQRLGRHRIIMDREDNEPYLERYYIFLKDRKWFPFNMFVHHFLKSDPDDVHDHPWPYMTIILRGGYWEWTPMFDGAGRKIGEKQQWKGAGQVRFGHSTDYHRIELDPDVDCWTLFCPGPKLREWGFLVKNKWIQNEEYFAQRKAAK